MTDNQAAAVFAAICLAGGSLFAGLAFFTGAPVGWVLLAFFAGATVTGDAVLSR